jgi:methionyl aminopeptidase
MNKNRELLESQRVAARIVSDVLKELVSLTKPGAKLSELDAKAERMILEREAIPVNKGYQPEWAKSPFPATVCMSVNEEVCHGIPGDRVLQEGDIITYDLGVQYRGGCGDAAVTVAVGEINNRKQRVMRVAKKTLYDAIRTVRAGAPISAVGKSVEANCLMYGMSTIKEFGGHHIGEKMHEPPFVPNHYYPENDSVFLEEGAIICIEPMITPGTGKAGIAGDNWTILTRDKQPVAMYEHMVLVTKDGYEILTDHIDDSPI